MLDTNLISLFAPALVACILISLVNGPLGAEVVRRGIIFIDLAIAHIAGLGFIAGIVLFPNAPFWILQFATYGFVLLFASFFFGSTGQSQLISTSEKKDLKKESTREELMEAYF